MGLLVSIPSATGEDPSDKKGENVNRILQGADHDMLKICVMAIPNR